MTALLVLIATVVLVKAWTSVSLGTLVRVGAALHAHACARDVETGLAFARHEPRAKA